jgi:hypothetical protein
LSVARDEERRNDLAAIKTINLKHGMPIVREALAQLERELNVARQQSCVLLKIVHGYGSHGVGGEIRIAVQKELRTICESGGCAGVIFGEDWRISNELTWQLLQKHKSLKQDTDLGRGNRGITIVVL